MITTFLTTVNRPDTIIVPPGLQCDQGDTGVLFFLAVGVVLVVSEGGADCLDSLDNGRDIAY